MVFSGVTDRTCELRSKNIAIKKSWVWLPVGSLSITIYHKHVKPSRYTTNH